MEAHHIANYLAIVGIKISVILSVIFIIKKMPNSVKCTDDTKYWLIYFLTAFFLTFLHAVYTIAGLPINVFHIVIVYVITAILLLYVLNEGLRRIETTALSVSVVVSLFILDLFLEFSNFEAMLLMVVSNYLLYGYAMYLAVQKARNFNNKGFYFISVAILMLISVSVIATYYLFQGESETVFAMAEFAANVGFLLVIVGFLAINIFNETKFLSDVALSDALTGMNNRRGLDFMLASIIPSSNRSFRCFSVISIDIDFFKKINDTYGHDGGDIVLQKFAEVIKNNHRNNDISCRFGGEEFVIVLPDTKKIEALVMAEKLRKIVEKTEIIIGDNRLNITASFGVATSCNELDIDKLIKESDKALYTAKYAGRNRVAQADV